MQLTDFYDTWQEAGAWEEEQSDFGMDQIRFWIKEC